MSRLRGPPNRSRCSSSPGAKHSIKMVQAGEPRLDRDIGDRMRGRLQEFLRVIDSYPKNLIKYRSLKLITKSTFQRSARNPAVGNDIVHRQIASGKVLLNVPERAGDVRVIDGENLGAFSCDHSLWRNSLGYLWRRTAIHQAVEQGSRFICHSFQVVPDTRQGHLYAIANYRVIVDAQNRHFVWNSNSAFDTGIHDVCRNAIVIAKNT